MNMDLCPVCGSSKLDDMLFLEHQPIFQHPVSSMKGIKHPYFKDLQYMFCNNCTHCFQKTRDMSVLKRIYEKYYYTPRPLGVGVQFQDHFMQTVIEKFNVLDRAGTILEVGCSTGQILTKIAALYPDKVLAGFEPNREACDRAVAAGLCVHRDFFSKTAVRKILHPFDLVFHRHVIEHVFDFQDFFEAHAHVCHAGSVLIIETPCLDWSVRNVNMAPFHIEHVHVFSMGSLKQLLGKFGWYLKAFSITSNGHLIGLFTREKQNLPVPKVEAPFLLTEWIEKNKRLLQKAAKGKKLAIWGAGSGGVKVINYFNLCPDIIVDNNPEKAGKCFVGYAHLKIMAAADWIEQEIHNSHSWLIVVASAYDAEICRDLDDSGWKGDIVRPYALSHGLHG